MGQHAPDPQLVKELQNIVLRAELNRVTAEHPQGFLLENLDWWWPLLGPYEV